MDISIIAPSHGPFRIIQNGYLRRYKDWTSDNISEQGAYPLCIHAWQHKRMVLMLTELLMERDIDVKPFNLTGADTGLLQWNRSMLQQSYWQLPLSFGPHPTMVVRHTLG